MNWKQFLKEWFRYTVLIELGWYAWDKVILPQITEAVELGVTRALQNQPRGLRLGGKERIDWESLRETRLRGESEIADKSSVRERTKVTNTPIGDEVSSKFPIVE